MVVQKVEGVVALPQPRLGHWSQSCGDLSHLRRLEEHDEIERLLVQHPPAEEAKVEWPLSRSGVERSIPEASVEGIPGLVVVELMLPVRAFLDLLDDDLLKPLVVSDGGQEPPRVVFLDGEMRSTSCHEEPPAPTARKPAYPAPLAASAAEALSRMLEGVTEPSLDLRGARRAALHRAAESVEEPAGGRRVVELGAQPSGLGRLIEELAEAGRRGRDLLPQ